MTKATGMATLALWVCWTSLVVAQTPETPHEGKPLGRWARKIDKTQVQLEVEDDRLHVKFTGEKSLVVHADYRFTKDRVLYGVITSVETDEDDPDVVERNLVDHVFSFGFRVDEGVLSIRDVKCSSEEFKGKTWNGRFKSVEQEKAVRQTPPTTSPSSYSPAVRPRSASTEPSGLPGRSN